MKLFSFFSNKPVNEFAKNLAQDVAKRYPPAFDNAPEKKISANRITKVLEDSYAKAIEFQKEHKLGVFKKAHLGNTFRWELKELGYSEKFVEVATEGLIVYITRKQAEVSSQPET